MPKLQLDQPFSDPLTPQLMRMRVSECVRVDSLRQARLRAQATTHVTDVARLDRPSLECAEHRGIPEVELLPEVDPRPQRLERFRVHRCKPRPAPLAFPNPNPSVVRSQVARPQPQRFADPQPRPPHHDQKRPVPAPRLFISPQRPLQHLQHLVARVHLGRKLLATPRVPDRLLRRPRPRSACARREVNRELLHAHDQITSRSSLEGGGHGSPSKKNCNGIADRSTGSAPAPPFPWGKAPDGRRRPPGRGHPPILYTRVGEPAPDAPPCFWPATSVGHVFDGRRPFWDSSIESRVMSNP